MIITVYTIYLTPPIAQATRDKEHLEKMVTELAARASEMNPRAPDLRHLSLLLAGLDSFALEDQRLALRALGVRVYANGDDPVCWRFEALFAAS